MENNLAKKFVGCFIKNADNTLDPSVRKQYGNLSGITGIVINIFLSVLKIVIGVLVGAISVVSDGINNLSDAGSSVITLIGFKLSSKKPNKDHPFGYGRIEYFAGLIVSVVIVVVAVELFIESLNKIISKESLSFESNTVLIITCVILIISILLKFCMAFLNRYIGKKIKSVAIEATSRDSISDCISTFVVLVSTVLSLAVKSVPIDGIAGVVVSLFIFYTGIKSTLEIVDLLIGTAPDKDFIKEIADYVINYDKNVVGIHDLMFHDYGPGRKVLILHVEVPADGNIMELHDLIDNIEKSLSEKFNLLATIHMDPVVVNSERVSTLKEVIKNIVTGIDENFSIHDFRMNEGETHANIIFDLVMTYESKLSQKEVAETVSKKVKEYDEKLNAVINVEYPLV